MSPNLIILSGSGHPRGRSLREPGALVCQIASCELARGGAVVKVPRGVFVFIAAVVAHPGAILSTAELSDLLYGDSPKGGPDNTTSALSHLAIRAEPALAALGYRLEIDKTHGRYARCCTSPIPVTRGAFAADLEPSHAQA